MANSNFIWRFTPSRTDPELLESIFVQRQALLASIQEKVADSVTNGNMHHVLLIGPRGIGKTHLISLLHHRITKDQNLQPRLRIAWFLEDETITSFVQLLKRIYELLSDEYPDQFPKSWLAPQLGLPPAQIEKNLEAELVRQFQNQTLLLFIENLDYVFEGLGADGQKKWRSFLQEHPFTCIVATSQRLFSGVQDRKQPFFGFFNPIHLKPLTVSDAVDLLTHIAEKNQQPDLVEYLKTPDGRSRVRAIHHLAGGNHRIYIVLSGFITKDSLDELTQPFEKMADELTPYYQERMRWLSPQQRQIVEFLCNQDTPCTPKEIAHQMLAGENTVSSQLKKLLQYGYVLRSPRGRESLYELAESLMRLTCEVKDKRHKPLRLLVDFLRIWYNSKQLSQLAELATSDIVRNHILAAIEKTINSQDPRVRIIQQDILSAIKENNTNEIIEALEELTTLLAEDADLWYILGHYQSISGQKTSSLRSLSKSIQLDPKHGRAWLEKATVLTQIQTERKSLATGLTYGEIFNHFTMGIALLINEILHERGNREHTSVQVEELIDLFDKSDSLSDLGASIVRSLHLIDKKQASNNDLDEWRNIWHQAGSKHSTMELPLRIFNIGIEYIKTNNESVMLNLISPERRILCQALGLEPIIDENTPKPTQLIP